MKKQPPQRPVIVCPGFHEAALTAQFVASVFPPAPILATTPAPPSHLYPLIVEAFCADPIAVFNWMTQTLGSPSSKDTQPILAIGFSGGVVGIAGAIALWQQQGGKIAKLLAIDGWGMPLFGLPVCRLSHDWFTHWSTLPLGTGEVNFYADPAVDHLQMWGDPHAAIGRVADHNNPQNAQKMSATDFIRQVLAASNKATHEDY